MTHVMVEDPPAQRSLYAPTPELAQVLTTQVQTFGACNTSCADLQISVHQPPS